MDASVVRLLSWESEIVRLAFMEPNVYCFKDVFIEEIALEEKIGFDRRCGGLLVARKLGSGSEQGAA